MMSIDNKLHRPFGMTDAQSYDFITIAAKYGLFGDAPYEFLLEVEQLFNEIPQPPRKRDEEV